MTYATHINGHPIHLTPLSGAGYMIESGPMTYYLQPGSWTHYPRHRKKFANAARCWRVTIYGERAYDSAPVLQEEMICNREANALRWLLAWRETR